MWSKRFLLTCDSHRKCPKHCIPTIKAVWITGKVLSNIPFLEDILIDKLLLLYGSQYVPRSMFLRSRSYEAKEKYRGVFEIQKSGDKTSSGEIGLDIRTHASPKVGQDQVSGGDMISWLRDTVCISQLPDSVSLLRDRNS